MLPPHEPAQPLATLGLVAFTTTRAAGTFGTNGREPVHEVMGRWEEMRRALPAGTARLATAAQVHGARVLMHDSGWTGWLRGDAADGHATAQRGIALAVTIADCVPVFLAVPGGAFALLHAGWRGIAAGILEVGVRTLERLGAERPAIVAHFGPAICGSCYEVSADVYAQLTGMEVEHPATIDLRELLTRQARALGLEQVSASSSCTRCGSGGFFSHRGGDTGRQIAVLCG